MTIKHLQNKFIAALKLRLPAWEFIVTERHFRKSFAHGNWLIHIAFVNHTEDFDAIVDVAVDFLDGKRRLCILGAGLGNIEGKGQVRYKVSTPEEAIEAAAKASAHFEQVGIPFLEYFSIANNVINCLKDGGARARLISPFEQLHRQQIESLTKFT